MRRASAMTLFLALTLLVSFVGLVGCNKGPDDVAIANDVKAKMFSDPDLKAANIEVLVNEGAVTLRGTVKRGETQQRAVDLAKSVTGVKNVYDETHLPGQRAPQPRASASASSAPAPTAPPAAVSSPASAQQTVELPVGTHVTIRTTSRIDSSTSRTGQTFPASLDAPVIVNGEHVIPRGADAVVLLTESRQAGKIKGRSSLEVTLQSLSYQGKTYSVNTTEIDKAGKSRGKDTAKKAAIGAAIGAGIGALAGQGKGAAIGAGAGAGAGVGYQMMTRGQSVSIPAESVLDFRLEEPVKVTYAKNAEKR